MVKVAAVKIHIYIMQLKIYNFQGRNEIFVVYASSFWKKIKMKTTKKSIQLAQNKAIFWILSL